MGIVIPKIRFERVDRPTVDVERRTVHSPLLHQVPDVLELGHDLVLLLLGHRLHTEERREVETT